MIRNAEGADDVVRAINKHSGCWAEATTSSVGSSRRVEEWTAELTVGIVGVCVKYARKRGGRRLYGKDAPKHVRDYLLVDDTARPFFHRTTLTRAELDAIAPGGDIVRVRPAAVFGRRVTFRVEHVRERIRPGVMVGREVGDSGSGPTEFVPFPTTEGAIYAAVDRVDSYARDLEVETGWSDDEAEPGELVRFDT